MGIVIRAGKTNVALHSKNLRVKIFSGLTLLTEICPLNYIAEKRTWCLWVTVKVFYIVTKQFYFTTLFIIERYLHYIRFARLIIVQL